MKKSILIALPVAALLLAGCRGSGGDSQASSSVAPSSSVTSATTSNAGPSLITSSAARPASPWPAVEAGGETDTAESPWNVSQAWDYINTQLTLTADTDSAKQDKVKSTERHYVRGYVCLVQDLSDPTNPKADPAHPYAVRFHLADNNHYVTEDEIATKDQNVRNGFCVYFADSDPAFESADAARDIQGRLVTVYGYLLNWKFEPEITSGGVITNIGEEKITPSTAS